MPGPINALRFVHTAILTESDRIERAATAAGSTEDLAALSDDVAFFENLVSLHTKGEELGLFPVLAEKAPHIDTTYLFDHEAERRSFTTLREAIAGGDLDGARRAALVLREHAHTHITKENTFILPLVDETIPPPEQGAMLGKILSTIPPESMAAAVPWIIERLPADDAAAYVRGLQGAMPTPAFEAAKGWIREGVSAAVWTELHARIPELAT